MLKMRADQVAKVRAFMDTKARSVDTALFSWHFDGGKVDEVATALKPYQCEDGGFGHGLEPDFWLERSSPMATTIGFQIMREIGLGVDHPMIQRAVKYLLNMFDGDRNCWHAVPVAVNDAPHAPWWHFDIATGRCGVEGTWANPNAEIVAHLTAYAQLVPPEFLARVTELAMAELNELPEKIDLHDFLCYQQLLEVSSGANHEHILTKLRASVPLMVSISPEDWSQYGTKPLQLCPTPQSEFYSILQDALPNALDSNLEFEIMRLSEQGCWDPNWSWFGNYDETWTQAKQAWQGALTVQTMKWLRSYERIEQ